MSAYRINDETFSFPPIESNEMVLAMSADLRIGAATGQYVSMFSVGGDGDDEDFVPETRSEYSPEFGIWRLFSQPIAFLLVGSGGVVEVPIEGYAVQGDWIRLLLVLDIEKQTGSLYCCNLSNGEVQFRPVIGLIDIDVALDQMASVPSQWDAMLIHMNTYAYGHEGVIDNLCPRAEIPLEVRRHQSGVYDFEALTTGSLVSPSQDGWTTVWPSIYGTPHDILVQEDAEGNQYATGNSQDGMSAYRVNDVSFSFDALAPDVTRSAMSADFRIGGVVGQYHAMFRLGCDGDDEDAVPESYSEYGPRFGMWRNFGTDLCFYLGNHEGDHEVVPSSAYAAFGDWVRLLLVLDHEQDTGSLYCRNLTRGEELFVPVSGLDGLPLALDTMPPDCSPRDWNTMLISMNSANYQHDGVIDNLVPRAEIPEYIVFNTNVSLVVAGNSAAHGASSPHDYGTNVVSVPLSGLLMTNTVVTPADEAEGVRYVCMGWTGSGSVPEVGTSNSVSFVLDEDSSLTWQWQPEYAVAAGVSGSGDVEISDPWAAEDSDVDLTAIASNGWVFVGWYQADPPMWLSDTQITVTVNAPVDLTAYFRDADGVFARHWLESGYFFPGRNVVECRFDVPSLESLLTFQWSVALPGGWTLVDASGDGGPLVDGDNMIAFTGGYINNPIEFSYTVLVPAGEDSVCELGGTASYAVHGMSNPEQVPAIPAPLVLRQHLSGFHSADYRDSRWVIDTVELSRVLMYWRSRYYCPDLVGFDGYAPALEPYEGDGECHSADYKPPYWRINAAEANRALAYWRAGGYRINEGGHDGYAPVDLTSPGGGPASVAPRSRLSVADAGASTGYEPGGTLSMTNVVTYDNTSVLALCVRPLLPDGWSIVSVTAAENPELRDNEILWTGTLPSSPVTIVYEVAVPVTSYGDKEIVTEAEVYVTTQANEATGGQQTELFNMDPTDEDEDGLPDAWEEHYADLSLDPDVDNDGDGLKNREEWIAGTDPVDGQSVLRFGEGGAEASAVTISWQSATGRTYRVSHAAALSTNFVPVASNIPANPPTNSATITDPGEGGFYRIEVEE